MDLRVQGILDKVCANLKLDDDVTGIILYGSLSENKEHKNSDIDLIVVKNEEVDMAKCLNVDGISIQMLVRSFTIFKNKLFKPTRYKPYSFSAQVLYDKNGGLQELINSAKEKAIEEGPLPLSENERYMALVALSLDIKTIEGLIASDNYEGATFIINELVLQIIDLYYDYHKWFKISNKHLIKDFKLRDPYLGEIASIVILSDDIKAKLANLLILRNTVLDLFGGEINEYEINFLR